MALLEHYRVIVPTSTIPHKTHNTNSCPRWWLRHFFCCSKMRLFCNARDICTLAAFYSALSTFGTHFKLNLWNPKTSCRFLLTNFFVTANCRARWQVERNGSSFSSRAICVETSIRGLPGRTSSWRSVLCALNSRTQYFTAPSEYESMPYTSDILQWIFFPPFTLSAIVKGPGSHLDFHFVNTEKMQTYGSYQRQQSGFRFLWRMTKYSRRIHSSIIHRATRAWSRDSWRAVNYFSAIRYISMFDFHKDVQFLFQVSTFPPQLFLILNAVPPRQSSISR
jgi:hypothetical protein